jgi:hypothetical protein
MDHMRDANEWEPTNGEFYRTAAGARECAKASKLADPADHYRVSEYRRVPTRAKAKGAR